MEDASEISALITELGYPTQPIEMQERLAKVLSHADFKTFVCQLDGKLVGMAGGCQSLYYEKNGYYVRITALVTTDDERKKGVGLALINAFENWAREIGASDLVLNCGNRPERDAAHVFYKKIGFIAKSTGYFKAVSIE
jgi:GNAT superfamily N-acetyltransferase